MFSMTWKDECITVPISPSSGPMLPSSDRRMRAFTFPLGGGLSRALIMCS
jgi:hypothetical protein